MKYFKIVISIMALSLVFNACEENFLERAPLDEVSTADYFKSPNDLRTYVNQFYDLNLTFPVNDRYGDDFGSNNQLSQENIDDRLAGTRVLGGGGGIWYGNVRDINVFFDNYQKVEENAEPQEYQQYVGEAHFFRALIYFDLLKSYGDVLWLETEVGPDSPELYETRDPRNVVADNIIADLDSAAMYLQEAKTNGDGRINKWMALLIQSRVALYEGTWEKYHDGTPFGVSNPDPDKYFEKAVNAATEIMDEGPYELYSTGNPGSDYYDLFSTHRSYAGNSEVMFWKKFDSEVTGADVVRERNFRMEEPTGHSLTKQLADSYLCTDGNPITGNDLFQGHATLSDEMQNRDPRFTQTIATPDAPWKIYENDRETEYFNKVYDNLNTTRDLEASTGYVLRKFYDARNQYKSNNFEDTPGIVYRYAEVLLNFAEAKAELGTITQADVERSINELRDRVGMPDLVLGDITTDPEWDFPDLSPEINEIRRERRVELAAEGFRWDDIARWAAADELIIGKRPKGFKAAQIDNNPFPVDENGFLDPRQNAHPNGYGFKPNRDYLNPISKEELALNPDLEQNPGWEE